MGKALVFILLFVVVVPAGVIAARFRESVRWAIFSVLIFFTAHSVDINISPIPMWKGSARGFSTTLVDICVLILMGSMLWRRDMVFRWRVPGVILFLLYCFWGAISGIGVSAVQPWGFELLKMGWMLLFFITMYNFFLNHRSFWPLAYTVIVLGMYMFVIGLWQKYLGGRYQIPSTMPHQNSLALYAIMFSCILYGILMNEKLNLFQMLMLFAGCGSFGLLVLFTLSRGGFLCFVVGIGMVTVASLLNRWEPRKGLILSFLVVGFVVVMAIYAPRIISRFQHAPETSASTRKNLAIAAVRIANDYPFAGVGLNNFSVYSGPGGKYAVEQYESVKVEPGEVLPGGVVETIYLLVAAECGWIGLFFLLCWFFYYWAINLRLLFSLKGQACFGIASGVFGGLSSNYLQSTMEWSLKQYNNFYQLMLVFAIIAALYSVRKNPQRKFVMSGGRPASMPGRNRPQTVSQYAPRHQSTAQTELVRKRTGKKPGGIK